MAKLIPSLIVFFCFTALLSSSHARSPITSPEDDAINLPPATFNEEDVSDLKSLIALPTDNLPDSDAVPLVNEDGEFSGDFQAVKSIDGGEKLLEEFHLAPMNRRFERMRAFRCRHGHHGPRSDVGDQIRPRKVPFWKEESDDEHYHHRHHHHGEVDEPRFHEVDPARFPGVEGDGRMIGEFKQPDFFFGRHHRHHHQHHDGDEDRFHHGDEEHEEREHHRHRRGHGFWKAIRKILGPF